MSGFYSAGQFDHAFQPIKLLNYQYSTNPWPGKYAICSPAKSCSTCYIANDCGHLFPWIPRNSCSSAWGDYATSIWEQTAPCLCISMLRHPEKFAPPRQIYITKEVYYPKAFAAKTAREFNDPCTKEGMVEDIICGRDPSCPGGGCPPAPILGCSMIGDPKTIKKRLRDQRRVEKKALMTGRGRRKGPAPCPELLTLRFGLTGGGPPTCC